MANMRRILITGSRNYTDRDELGDALLDEAIGKALSNVIVVHGGARGADAIAGQVAREFGMQVEVHPADWSLGKAAGHIRNQRMVDLGADVCLAFPLDGSRGTWDCVRRAREAGIEVVVHAPIRPS